MIFLQKPKTHHICIEKKKKILKVVQIFRKNKIYGIGGSIRIMRVKIRDVKTYVVMDIHEENS